MVQKRMDFKRKPPGFFHVWLGGWLGRVRGKWHDHISIMSYIYNLGGGNANILYFHPEPCGNGSQFDVRIFLKWVESQPPTRSCIRFLCTSFSQASYHVSIIFCAFILAHLFPSIKAPPEAFLQSPKSMPKKLPKESSANHSCNEWNENCSTSKARCSSWSAVCEWDVGWVSLRCFWCKTPPQIRLFQHFFRQVWRCGFLPDVHVVHAGTFARLIFTISLRLFQQTERAERAAPGRNRKPTG